MYNSAQWMKTNVSLLECALARVGSAKGAFNFKLRLAHYYTTQPHQKPRLAGCGMLERRDLNILNNRRWVCAI